MACKNKVFEKRTIDGCTECVKNNQHCFHSGAIMSKEGSGPKLVLDFEMY